MYMEGVVLQSFEVGYKEVEGTGGSSQEVYQDAFV